MVEANQRLPEQENYRGTRNAEPRPPSLMHQATVVTDSGSSGVGVVEPETCYGPGCPSLEPRGIQISVDVMVCKSVSNSYPYGYHRGKERRNRKIDS